MCPARPWFADLRDGISHTCILRNGPNRRYGRNGASCTACLHVATAAEQVKPHVRGKFDPLNRGRDLRSAIDLSRRLFQGCPELGQPSNRRVGLAPPSLETKVLFISPPDRVFLSREPGPANGYPRPLTRSVHANTPSQDVLAGK
jgi:hypothetical protein